jgi:hypothetical protein
LQIQWFACVHRAPCMSRMVLDHKRNYSGHMQAQIN